MKHAHTALVLAAATAALLAAPAAEAASKTLAEVKARGYLKCGVSDGLAGFSNPDAQGNWTGIDVDVCRAVAAAIFDDPNAVRYTATTAKERFTALQSGEFDLLSRNTTITMQRDVALGLRMLPIGTVFSQFTRLLRDLSATLGKEVEFEALGGDTELDKTVIDRIKDPLVHLLRNSLDHGIEPPAERLAAGKSARGRVTLSASHSGGNVVIAISDDGRGINVAAVRKKAVAGQA